MPPAFPMLTLALFLLAANADAFTWVDGIKIVLIPVILFILNRVFNRRDKSHDEEKAKKEAEAKEREKRINEKIATLETQVSHFVGEEALEKRFAKLEEARNNHEQRMTGFQVQHERFAEDTNRRTALVETQLGQVAQLREDMAGVKAELKGYGRSIDEVKEMVRELLRSNK